MAAEHVVSSYWFRSATPDRTPTATAAVAVPFCPTGHALTWDSVIYYFFFHILLPVPFHSIVFFPFVLVGVFSSTVYHSAAGTGLSVWM
jgi:hypothetical protein